jgi:hypothetical protein
VTPSSSYGEGEQAKVNRTIAPPSVGSAYSIDLAIELLGDVNFLGLP